MFFLQNGLFRYFIQGNLEKSQDLNVIRQALDNRVTKPHFEEKSNLFARGKLRKGSYSNNPKFSSKTIRRLKEKT